MNGISVRRKDVEELASSLSTPLCSPPCEVTARRGPSPEPNHASLLILDFQAPELRTTCLLLGPPVCGALLQWPKLTETGYVIPSTPGPISYTHTHLCACSPFCKARHVRLKAEGKKATYT